ncbi:MAG: bifunctional hydroxymethylpyrimidine kinase/phosphomethylpyrimidine kinase [Myxococcales bacterium]|nr:bifunctional hydroxymethylpyrimidine kinase/phosphomethylpyrimidine kinase [Myxococcales bacterium]
MASGGDRGRGALWILAGLDPSGGAGILRDLWTLRALAPGITPGPVISAFTWQGRGAPARAEARPLAAIARDLADLPPARAVKVGLAPASLIEAGLVERLREAAQGAPIVVDPVLLASDGGDLGARPEQLRRLAAAATLVTPNLAEAVALAGVEGAPGALAARIGGSLGGVACLVKGGHGGDPRRVCDHLWVAGELHEVARARGGGGDPRGTGCALATAIAAGLAGGAAIPAAVAGPDARRDEARPRARPGRDGRLHLPID